MDGGANGAHRLIENELHPHRRREMKDGIALAGEQIHRRRVLDGITHEVKARDSFSTKRHWLPARWTDHPQP